MGNEPGGAEGQPGQPKGRPWTHRLRKFEQQRLSLLHDLKRELEGE